MVQLFQEPQVDFCDLMNFLAGNAPAQGFKDDEETLDLFIQKIEELKAKVGIKKSIAEYGISEEAFMSTLDQMVEDAFDDQCTGANPRYPLLKEIKAMYLKAYYGEKA